MNPTELSDQAIISGIKIGGQSETKAIQAIYEKHANYFTQFIDVTDLNANNSLLWESVECLVHGVKNDLITFKDNNRTIEFYLHQLARKIQNPDAQSMQEVSRLYEDKLVWDYYLMLLARVESNDNQLLTRIYGEGITTNDLAERLVAKGVYTTAAEVKAKKTQLIDQLIVQL